MMNRYIFATRNIVSKLSHVIRGPRLVGYYWQSYK